MTDEVEEHELLREGYLKGLKAGAEDEREACALTVLSLVGLGGRFSPGLLEEVAAVIRGRVTWKAPGK